MRKLTMLIGLVLGSFLLHAQKNYAVGVIDSKTGNPIVGASIKIMSSGKISTTSESGNVVMLISPDDSLMITAKGYKDRKLQMAGQFVALSIILDPIPIKDKIATKPKKKRVLKPSK
jgi:iron complex outermembrane recepter protein